MTNRSRLLAVLALVSLILAGLPFSTARAEAGDPPAAGSPVSTALANHFGVDEQVIAGYLADGFGYGVIAQACWMSYRLAGDASLCGQILSARASGDYSGLTLPDGTTAANWGQFKKAVGKDKGQNLGAIMSGNQTKDKPDKDKPEKDKSNGKGNSKNK